MIAEGGQGLVPVALAEVTADGIRFGCTLAEFARLQRGGEAHFVPGTGGDGVRLSVTRQEVRDRLAGAVGPGSG